MWPKKENVGPATYPVLLIPKELDLRHFRSTKYPPPVEPIKPDKPSYRAEFYFNTTDFARTAFCVLGLIIIPELTSDMRGPIPTFSTVGAIFVLLFMIYHPVRRYSEAKDREANMNKEYSSQLRYYELALIKYKSDLSIFNSPIEKRLREARIAEERRLMARKAIHSTYQHTTKVQLEGQLIGASEGILYTSLKKRFPDQIHRDIGFKIYNGRPRISVFRPDMVYIDDSTKLTIAIEVDEPYIFENGQPIHYLGISSATSSVDDEINGILLQGRWLVVRFSERQVIKHTESCASFIESLVYKLQYADDLIDGGAFIQEHFPSSERDVRWTYEEAQQMAAQDYRKSYR